MTEYLEVAFWALAGGLFSVIGGAVLLVNKKVADRAGTILTPFAAGALLGAAFFDLLPEAVELNAEGAAFRWAVVGIIAFFILEQYLHWFHHHHEHQDKTYKKPTAPFVIIGDTLHNAIDGVAIGAAFVISPPIGIVTAIAVAAHEIPQEIGDFSILLKAGMKRSKVFIWNAVSSLATLITALYTFWLGSNAGLPLGPILGLSAGLFIYIAASDLIPTIHQEVRGGFAKFPAILLIAGVLIVGLVTEVAHEQLHGAERHESESGLHH